MTFPALIVLEDDLLEICVLLDEEYDLKNEDVLVSSLDNPKLPDGTRAKDLTLLALPLL